MDLKDFEESETIAKYIVTICCFLFVGVIIRKKVLRSRGQNLLKEPGQEICGEIMAAIRDFTVEFRETKRNQELAIQSIANRMAADRFELSATVSSIMDRMAVQLEEKTNAVCQNIAVALDMEQLKNDQRSNKTNRMVDALRDDLRGVVEAAKMEAAASAAKSDEQPKWRSSSARPLRQTTSAGKRGSTADASAQTDHELLLRKRPRDHPNAAREGTVNDSESVRSVVSIVKKSLAELTSEARTVLARGAEEERRDIRQILCLLTEDRQDIKNEIVRAFTATAEQDQKNFAQFSHIGQEAMHYMTLLSETSNQNLMARLVDVEETLKEVLSVLNRQMCDVIAVVENLNETKEKFEEVNEKLEFSYRNTEESNVAYKNKLEDLSKKWNSRDKKLEEIITSLDRDTKEMSLTLKDVSSGISRKSALVLEKREPGTVDSVYFNASDTAHSFEADMSQCCEKLGHMVKLVLRCTNLLENIFKSLDHKAGHVDVLFEHISGNLRSVEGLVNSVARDADRANDNLLNLEKNCQVEDITSKLCKCSNVIFAFVQNVEEVNTRTRGFLKERRTKRGPVGRDSKADEDRVSDRFEFGKKPGNDPKFMTSVIDQILLEAHNVKPEGQRGKRGDVDQCRRHRAFNDGDGKEDGTTAEINSKFDVGNLTSVQKSKANINETVAIPWANIHDEPSVEAVSNSSLISNSTDSDHS